MVVKKITVAILDHYWMSDNRALGALSDQKLVRVLLEFIKLILICHIIRHTNKRRKFVFLILLKLSLFFKHFQIVNFWLLLVLLDLRQNDIL